MDDLHKKLIEERLTSEERLATPEEMAHIKENLWLACSGDGRVFSNKKNAQSLSPYIDIKKYIMLLPKKSTARQYNPKVEPLLESTSRHYGNLGEQHTQQEYVLFMKAISQLLTTYRQYLSFDDIIELYFQLVDVRLEGDTEEITSGINDTLVLLEHMKGYEKQLDEEQKYFLWRCIGIAYFSKAGLHPQSESSYFWEAVKAIDRALEIHRGNYNEHYDTQHKNLLHLKVSSLFSLYANEETLIAIQDSLKDCGRDPVKKTYDDVKDSFQLAETFFMQGETYEALREYSKAIESYNNYLIFYPDNEQIQESIAGCMVALEFKKNPPK